jgi:O-antigen/teichoic acid export membrane protein
MIKKIRTYINKSELTKNTLTLVTGTSIAQILPVVISPILTRIYSPSDFGVLALFISITMIFGTIANARYELAVILPEKDEDAINIFALGLTISTILSTLLLIFVIVFHSKILVWLGNDNISFWLYLAPIVIFLVGAFNMLNYYSTRKKYYKDISHAFIYKSVSTVFVQLGLAFLKNGAIGLISGYSIGNLSGNLKMIKNVFKDKKTIKKINVKDAIEQGRRYSRFPKFTLPASFANILSIELINILISKLFSIATLGYYSFANRVLSIPSSFIGKSVSQVYIQEAATEKRNTGKAIIIFKSITTKLVVVGLPFFVLLFFISEWLFVIVFGEEWRLAGVYAKIITPLIFIRFVVAPISVSLSVFEKQHISLLWQVGLLILALISIFLSFYLKLDFQYFLYIFVAVLSLYYIILFILLNQVVKGKL